MDPPLPSHKLPVFTLGWHSILTGEAFLSLLVHTLTTAHRFHSICANICVPAMFLLGIFNLAVAVVAIRPDAQLENHLQRVTNEIGGAFMSALQFLLRTSGYTISLKMIGSESTEPFTVSMWEKWCADYLKKILNHTIVISGCSFISSRRYCCHLLRKG